VTLDAKLPAVGLRTNLRTGTDQLRVRQGDQAYMVMADLCAAFSVGQSTASAKARSISDALHAHCMDPAWMLPTLVA